MNIVLSPDAKSRCHQLLPLRYSRSSVKPWRKPSCSVWGGQGADRETHVALRVAPIFHTAWTMSGVLRCKMSEQFCSDLTSVRYFCN